jgi:hypothetical protein
MIVRIPAVGTPELLDGYNFRELKVVGDPSPHPALGRMEGDHVFLDPKALTRLAGGAAGDPGWRNGFAEMVAYAAKRDWIDDAGFVRAHVEPLTS